MIGRTVLALVLAQAPAPTGPPSQPPSPPSVPVDPAAATFDTAVGLLLVPVKADRTADYEAAVTALQQAMSASADASVQSQARGWRIYKATEVDAKGNALYVHALAPAVMGVEYRPSLLLDQLLKDAPVELLAKYKESLAGAPTRLSLTEVANMAVAPVKK